MFRKWFHVCHRLRSVRFERFWGFRLWRRFRFCRRFREQPPDVLVFSITLQRGATGRFPENRSEGNLSPADPRYRPETPAGSTPGGSIPADSTPTGSTNARPPNKTGRFDADLAQTSGVSQKRSQTRNDPTSSGRNRPRNRPPGIRPVRPDTRRNRPRGRQRSITLLNTTETMDCLARLGRDVRIVIGLRPPTPSPPSPGGSVAGSVSVGVALSAGPDRHRRRLEQGQH